MNWVKKDIGPELVIDIRSKFGCEALTSAILVRRGVIRGEEILYYLENEPRYLHSPFLFKNMEDAVDRIHYAKDEGERVLIFGDRDVDGITSTSLLYEGLRDFGLDVSWRIPTGDDAYGLSVDAVEDFAKNDGTLIITVDCGISNFAEIEFARSKGIDVIVVDHHSAQENLPNATVILNPKVDDSGYPFKDLSGCAVAWKLLLALRFSLTEMYKQPVCLLNVRPVNEAYTVEVVKLLNLVEVARISETITPDVISFSDTRLGGFLSGQQIFAWNAPQQTRLLAKAFGSGVEFNFVDFQQVVRQKFPQLGALSLLRLKEKSTIGKYYEARSGELDAFVNIFITFIQQANNFYGAREKSEVQLVALSTLADMMALKDENRLIVRLGLAEMNKKPRVGLSDLLAKRGLLNYKIGTHDLSWQITPLINATGRMGRPEVAIQMFTTDNPSERIEKIEEILQMNEQRKEISEECWSSIYNNAFESFEKYNHKLVVVASDAVHRGVTGILSGRLVNTFNVPGIIICKMPDGTATASCRSARGFCLLEILEFCSDLLLDYGGHDFAAGFSVEQNKLPELLDRLKIFSETMEFSESSETNNIAIDAELPPKYLTPDLLNVIDLMEPYGQESPELIFMAKNVKIVDAMVMGKTDVKHLKLTLATGEYKWTGLYWKAADLLNKDFSVGDNIDIVFNITRNYFNGNITPQMIIKDAKKGA